MRGNGATSMEIRRSTIAVRNRWDVSASSGDEVIPEGIEFELQLLYGAFSHRLTPPAGRRPEGGLQVEHCAALIGSHPFRRSVEHSCDFWTRQTCQPKLDQPPSELRKLRDRPFEPVGFVDLDDLRIGARRTVGHLVGNVDGRGRFYGSIVIDDDVIRNTERARPGPNRRGIQPCRGMPAERSGWWRLRRFRRFRAVGSNRRAAAVPRYDRRIRIRRCRRSIPPLELFPCDVAPLPSGFRWNHMNLLNRL